MIGSMRITASLNSPYSYSSLLNEIPFEAAAFAVAGLALQFFFPSLSAPLFGISIALASTKLVLKFLDRYDNVKLLRITKEACKLNKSYPNLQLVGFIASLALSLLSQNVGFVVGIAVGAFGAVILDIENYKLMQQANRRNL